MIISPEANFDLLFLLYHSKKRYQDLHETELSLLAYLAQLLSIYDGKRTNDWGYYFTYHSLGGPYSTEIVNELDTLTRSGIILKSKENDNYYRLSSEKQVGNSVYVVMKLDRFSWRVRYLETALNSCLTKSFPEISHAMMEEPGLSDAENIGSRTILHSERNDSIYEYFHALKSAIGDMREDILIPASVWIEYLLLLSSKRAGEIDV